MAEPHPLGENEEVTVNPGPEEKVFICPGSNDEDRVLSHAIPDEFRYLKMQSWPPFSEDSA